TAWIEPRPLPRLPSPATRSARPPGPLDQFDGIRSAHIKYRDVTVTSRDLKPLPLAEVLKVLAEADLDNDPEAAIDVAAKLPRRENLARNLPAFEFISDGRRTRESGNSWVRIDDGEWDVNSSRGQTDVSRDGPSQFAPGTLSRLVVTAPPAAEV